MIVYPEVTIEWAGKEHEIKVTMKVINKIEQTVSLAGLISRVQTGDVPLSHLAVVYANMLRSAGVQVADDDVYGAMFGEKGESELTQQEVINAAVTALAACFPSNAPKGK